MSSNISFIVNTILLVIPIVGTIGVLLGIDAYREAAGQKPLFSDQATNTGTDHHENTPDNGIISMQFCDISYGISPSSRSQQYTCKLFFVIYGSLEGVG